MKPERKRSFAHAFRLGMCYDTNCMGMDSRCGSNGVLPEGFKLYGDGFPVREQRRFAGRFKIAREGQEEIL